MKLYLGHRSLSQYCSDKQEFIKKYLYCKSENSKKYNKYMAFGDTIHITLAKFNLIRKPRDKTLENLYHLFSESWLSLGYETKEEEKQYFKKGLNILKAYYNDPKDESKKTIFVEEMLTKELPNNVVLFGKVDKVFINALGQLEVLDYKTSNNINFILNPFKDFQLSLYLLLVKHRLGYYPKVISYYYLSKNVKASHVVKIEDIARLERHFTDTIISMQNDCLAIKQPS